LDTLTGAKTIVGPGDLPDRRADERDRDTG
jgi:hypothetical protein